MDFQQEPMNQEESMFFTIVNDAGEEIQCEILFSFEDNKTGKNYIVYTDNTLDENGNSKVYASVYKPDSEDTTLYPIETEEEWEQIETLLNQLQDQVTDMDDWDVTAVD